MSDRELELSATLVDSFASDFDPAAYVDEYQQELQAMITRKIEEGETVTTPVAEDEEADTGGEVIDLMAALQASIERSRKTKKSDENDKEETEPGAPRESTAS